MPEVAAAKAIVTKLRAGELPPEFTSRDVLRPGWAMLTDRDQVREALNLLVELDWLEASRVETGGRPATVYQVNPRGLHP